MFCFLLVHNDNGQRDLLLKHIVQTLLINLFILLNPVFYFCEKWNKILVI